MFKEAENLVKTVIPEHLAEAAPEVAVYLKESVGNSTRIDYGTGTFTCTLNSSSLAGLRLPRVNSPLQSIYATGYMPTTLDHVKAKIGQERAGDQNLIIPEL